MPAVLAIGLIGYNTAVQVQTAEVSGRVYSVATLVPGLFYLAVAVCLITIYPLSKKKVEENIAILNSRNSEN